MTRLTPQVELFKAPAVPAPSVGLADRPAPAGSSVAELPATEDGLDGVTHAITLWPEWAYAVAHLGKDVENRGDTSKRSYVPLRGYVGQRVAIHAGAYIGGRPAGHGPLKWRSSGGMRAMLDTASRSAGRPVFVAPSDVVRRCIVCTAVIGPPVTDHPSTWAVPGAWHFPLFDVRPASSGPRPGLLGVWRIA